MDLHKITCILDSFKAQKISISDFLIHIVSDQSFYGDTLVQDLSHNATRLLSALTEHLQKIEHTVDINDSIFGLLKSQLCSDVKKLITHGDEWQFGASSARAHQLEEFQLDQMADKMARISPCLWNILETLLSSTQKASSSSQSLDSKSLDSTFPDQEEEYWEQADDIGLEGIIEIISGDKKVVIISIIMQSTNQKTNALASIIGIFLHSCKTPEKVVEALARLGISISLNAIHNAITSLSAESANCIRALGQTLLVNYAYDNFDVNIQTSVPTVQRSATTLKHLTSGLIFPLQHGVTLDDMKCSERLWKQSHLNLHANPSDIPPSRSWKDIIDHFQILHPESNPPITLDGLSQREQFISWKFLQDLCDYGPSYFAQFRNAIEKPQTIEQIPLIKTEITPVRSMEFSNSTVSGNISTIKNLMNQAGIGDPKDPDNIYEVVDGAPYVVLFHGDLGTGDRIISIQTRRSAEATPWERFQYVIFVPGLFHVKMACADALYRIFIQPTAARHDDSCLMRDIGKLRPKETGIYASNPGFRRMHQLILHSGICRRLDCWITEASQLNKEHKSLEDFAQSKPSLEKLRVIANNLAKKFIADFRMPRLRRQPKAQRDQQYENALLLNKYFLLYEELSYAMNEGDIGRVENCLVPWIFIFRATGKHKYAHHITQFLTNVHFNFPEGLKKAIRYHMLVNPTGKPGKFRGVDWCVELNNLYTKDVHGGESSNNTITRIIKESPLVQVYRNAKNIIAFSRILTFCLPRMLSGVTII
ncbi:hypothetical protein C0992_006774 [Termitomyces sp. T32_za158]|nr:hypothetical protein C0992_006774 [Termitomyces sp. T32_za158]